MSQPSPLAFSELREFFADDVEYGQLCDLVVVDADRGAWGGLFEVIAARYPYQFFVRAEGGSTEAVRPARLTREVATTLSFIDSETGASASLSFDVEGLTVNVHLFSESWIEMDCWRTHVTRERYDEIAALMERVGDATGRDVFMTPERASSEAAMAYEVAARRFRRPLHGIGSEGRIRAEVFKRFGAAMGPIREVGKRLIADEVLKDVLARVEAIRDSYSELVLQDELTVEDRRDFDNAWSCLATIVRPPPGVETAQYRSSYERDLVKLAQRYVV